MESGDILKAVRTSSGVSQTELARRTSLYQSNISAIESGINGAGVGTISELLSAMGYRLIPVHTRARFVAEAAVDIAKALASGQEKRAYRHFILLNDELKTASPDVRVALCSTPPPLVGDSRYDALIAGLVEHHLRREHLPLPIWLSEPARFLKEEWFVSGIRAFRERDKKETPPSFSRRKVFLPKTELISV